MLCVIYIYYCLEKFRTRCWPPKPQLSLQLNPPVEAQLYRAETMLLTALYGRIIVEAAMNMLWITASRPAASALMKWVTPTLGLINHKLAYVQFCSDHFGSICFVSHEYGAGPAREGLVNIL